MKVKEHFNVMMDYFHREHMDFALAGAYALHAYGYTRATRDVDFLTRQETNPLLSLSSNRKDSIRSIDRTVFPITIIRYRIFGFILSTSTATLQKRYFRR